ncbi:type I restriction enzyme S subunit [Jejuia pallidilutea]|uniref:Type I restriction enzyme S subunit n=1 Tax=Jejuia pallidilutea TaxID=504487 RepID=A0A362XEX0_9FLAO|nr:restriction endonuclease subunit S [Jejuia pallidilutea]PQV51780.1 type I restriction enzyme S subunit [Jejuia pallidilutea]
MELLQPKLRFIEFKNQWIKTKLGALGVFKGGGTPATNKANYWKGNTPWISSSDILENDIFNINITRYISNEAIEESAAKLVPLNSVLFVSRVGIGKLAVSNLNLCTSQDFANLTPKKDNSWFIAYYFLSKNKLLHQFAQGTSIKGFTTGDLKSIPINLPSIPEQQKIASFLTDVDDKITKLTKKKDLLEQYKKGIMQKIFSQELRFKDDNGNAFPKWEVKKLGDLGSTLNGLTGKTKENFGSGKPYIQYKQIFDSSKINIDNCGLVDVTSTDNQTKVQYGDVFFTTSSETPNEIGTASVLLDSVGEMYLNSFCFGFRVNQSILYPSFSQFLFRSNDFRKKMIPLAQGSTRYNISKSSFLKLKVYLPSIEEQTKIANFLSDIDIKIEALNTKIENSKAFKKGLLQQMFV